MADDELLPEDAPAEEPIPDEAPMEEAPVEEGTGAEAAPAEEVAVDEGGGEEVAIEDSGINSGVMPAPYAPTPVEETKPKSNVWTLLMIIAFLSMIVGIFLQWTELTEFYKFDKFLFG